uniref:Uncharacterized protein n=1 Tax=viral metagenome TaxID=1070528 RepID=A0A6H1ZP02_9ZZZZ
MAGRLDALADTVGLYKCEKCGFTYKVDELVEEDKTNLIVCKKCEDQVSFEEQKVDEGGGIVEHHFTT